MNEKLQAYFDEQKLLSEKREKELRDEILIKEGLAKKVYSEDNTQTAEYKYYECDSEGRDRYYKIQPIDVTDEEFAKIKEIRDNRIKYKAAQRKGSNASSNSVAIILKVIAWLTYILGFIAGIVACAEINKYSSDAGGTTVLFTWWAAAFISGTLFLGFAEIIQLLNDIKYKK